MIIGSQSNAGAEKMMPSFFSSNTSSYVLSEASLCAMSGAISTACSDSVLASK